MLAAGTCWEGAFLHEGKFPLGALGAAGATFRVTRVSSAFSMLSGEEMPHLLPRRQGWLCGAEEDGAQPIQPQDMSPPSGEGAGSCRLVIQEET